MTHTLAENFVFSPRNPNTSYTASNLHQTLRPGKTTSENSNFQQQQQANPNLPTLLLSCQRVSRRWHSVIASSTSLQRALFLLADLDTPAPNLQPSVPPPAFKPRLVQNPLLAKAFPCFFQLTGPGNHGPNWLARKNVLPATDYHYLPYAPHCDCRYSIGFRLARDSGEPDKRQWMGITDTRGDGRRREAFMRKGASWRRMLVSQPPPVVVGRMGSALDGFVPQRPSLEDMRWLYLEPREEMQLKGPAKKREGFLVEVARGLRMGELYDAVVDVNWGYYKEFPAGVYRNYGAWVAWKGTKEMNSCECEYDGAHDVSTSPLAWLAAADLVIGEHDKTTIRGDSDDEAVEGGEANGIRGNDTKPVINETLDGVEG
ncbi:hypothetical protein N0V88_002110 [Collariella sp. IMI 366227]|nr:hypothetical protein N0V88_002110 [Collariella sp. IMI 366227]